MFGTVRNSDITRFAIHFLQQLPKQWFCVRYPWEVSLGFALTRHRRHCDVQIDLKLLLYSFTSSGGLLNVSLTKANSTVRRADASRFALHRPKFSSCTEMHIIIPGHLICVDSAGFCWSMILQLFDFLPSAPQSCSRQWSSRSPSGGKGAPHKENSNSHKLRFQALQTLDIARITDNSSFACFSPHHRWPIAIVLVTAIQQNSDMCSFRCNSVRSHTKLKVQRFSASKTECVIFSSVRFISSLRRTKNSAAKRYRATETCQALFLSTLFGRSTINTIRITRILQFETILKQGISIKADLGILNSSSLNVGSMSWFGYE